MTVEGEAGEAVAMEARPSGDGGGGGAQRRTYDQEHAYIARDDGHAVRYTVREGFVPGMRVPGRFYVNEPLKGLLLGELEAYCGRDARGGGFLPAVKQVRAHHHPQRSEAVASGGADPAADGRSILLLPPPPFRLRVLLSPSTPPSSWGTWRRCPGW